MKAPLTLPPYSRSAAGTLLAAREAVMAPIRPMLRDAGVTEQQWRVLRVLADEGALDLSRLARLALLHGPSVTRISRQLLERRLVRNSSDPHDARRAIMTLSSRGRALLKSTIPRAATMLEAYRAAFGADRLAALVRDLDEFARSIAKFASEGDRIGADDVEGLRRPKPRRATRPSRRARPAAR